MRTTYVPTWLPLLRTSAGDDIGELHRRGSAGSCGSLMARHEPMLTGVPCFPAGERGFSGRGRPPAPADGARGHARGIVGWLLHP